MWLARACTLWLLSALPAAAMSGSLTVAVAVADDAPPLTYGAPDAPRGLYPALIAAAFADSGQPATLRALPWRRALALLDQGQAAVGGIYRIDRRDTRYDYSEPLFTEHLVLVTRRGHPVHLRALTDLAGQRIGVLAGWRYGGGFWRVRRDGRSMVNETGSDRQNFDMLRRGRLDAVLSLERVARPILRQPRYASLTLRLVPHGARPTYLAFSKNAHAGATLAAFNLGLRRLKQHGRYRQLVAEALSAPVPTDAVDRRP